MSVVSSGSSPAPIWKRENLDIRYSLLMVLYKMQAKSLMSFDLTKNIKTSGTQP